MKRTLSFMFSQTISIVGRPVPIWMLFPMYLLFATSAGAAIPQYTAQIFAVPSNTSTVPLTSTGASGQTGDLEDWYVVSSLLAKVDASGNETAVSHTSSGGAYYGDSSGYAVICPNSSNCGPTQQFQFCAAGVSCASVGTVATNTLACTVCNFAASAITSSANITSGTNVITGQHYDQSSGTQCCEDATLSSGSVTWTFPVAYSSTPVCVASPHNTANTIGVIASATQVTVNSSSGSDSQVVHIICIGNPN